MFGWTSHQDHSTDFDVRPRKKSSSFRISDAHLQISYRSERLDPLSSPNLLFEGGGQVLRGGPTPGFEGGPPPGFDGGPTLRFEAGGTPSTETKSCAFARDYYMIIYNIAVFCVCIQFLEHLLLVELYKNIKLRSL